MPAKAKAYIIDEYPLPNSKLPIALGIGFHSIFKLIADTHHMFPGKRHNLKDLFISCLF